MNSEINVLKSENFIGPMGWGSVLNKDNFYLLAYKESDGFVRPADVSLDDYFEKTISNLILDHDTDVKLLINNYVNQLSYKFESRGEKLNICGLLVNQNKLHLVIKGKLNAYLLRNAKIVQLSSGGDSIYVEGKAAEGDIVLVSTTRFLNIKLASELLLSGNDVLQKSKNTPFLRVEIKRIFEPKISDFTVHKGDFSGSIDAYVPINQDKNIKLKKYPSGVIEKIKSTFGNVAKMAFIVKDEEYEKSLPRKRTAAFVGLLLLLFLVISVYFGIKGKKEQDLKSSYQSQLTEARHKLDESINIYSLSKERSRELFFQSREIVNKLSEQNIDDPDFLSLKSDLEAKQGTILGEFNVSPETFVDLGLLTDNFHGQKIIMHNENIYIVDKESRKIVKIGIISKRSEVVVGPNKIDQIYDATGYSDLVFVLNKEGVFEVSGSREKVLDEKFSENILGTIYSSNLYVLNKENSSILRFPSDGDVFGKGKDWLAEDVDLSLGTARNLIVDGSIWVLTNENKIYKFVQGNLQNFDLESDLSSNLNINSIYTNDELLSLYVLDKNAGKVLVFTKEGEFLAQYIAEDIKNSSGLVVSEKNKKIVLLNGSKLVSMDLKHI